MIKVNKSYHISKEDDGEAEYGLYHTKCFIATGHGYVYRLFEDEKWRSSKLRWSIWYYDDCNREISKKTYQKARFMAGIP